MSAKPEPTGPICAFGSRLAFTYFAHPAPHPDLLNSARASPDPSSSSSSSNHPRTESTDSLTATATTKAGEYWFTIDDQLVYLSFFQDYGPLNIACLYRFCLHLHNILESPAHKNQRIFLYSSDEPDKKVNAALLMSLYAMVVMRWSVADVLHPISCLELQPYRDAGYSRSDYHLHPQQILYGLSRALSHQLLDLSTFDLAAYEKAEKVEEGDWNWITPGFIAFASPVEAGWNQAGGGGGGGATAGRLTRSFRNVLEEFENKNVKVVVRLNKKLYDRNHFLERGIDHVEMYFDDGTNPTMDMCREFIDLSDRVISSGGAVAVHCKAGLGRTGTLIGAYLIYKHGFTADEAIGFMRLMRPGSCVGPQQHFLYENQLEWVRWAAQDELRLEFASAAASATRRQAEQVAATDREGGQGASVSTTTTTTTTTGGTRRSERECSVTSSAAAGPPRRPITPPNESELREQQARQRSSTPHHHHHASAAATTTSTSVAPPVTPRRQTGNVPGQPRKTPGRSRHGVAAPETNNERDSPDTVVVVDAAARDVGAEDVEMDKEEQEEEEEEAARRDEEEMEGISLVSNSPNKKKRDSTGGGGSTRRTTRKSLQLVQDGGGEGNEAGRESGDEEEEDPLTMLPTSSPKKLLSEFQRQATTTTTGGGGSTNNKASSPGSTRPKPPTSSTTTNRPTRIARSATAGGTGSSTDPTAMMIGRSRGAKNLNTVFESVAGAAAAAAGSSSSSNATAAAAGGAGGGGNHLGPTASTRSRYPLRNVSGRTTPNHAPPPASSTTTTTGGGGVIAPNSPSKLPTRIPAKRGVPSSPVPPPSSSSHHHHHQHHESQPQRMGASSTRGGGGFDPASAATTTATATTRGGGGGGGFTTSLANGLAKLGGAGGGRGARNVRRRRSSMGSQDFVQAG